MTQNEIALLMEAVGWYDRFCGELGQDFDSTEAVYLVVESAGIELDETEVEDLASLYSDKNTL